MMYNNSVNTLPAVSNGFFGDVVFFIISIVAPFLFVFVVAAVIYILFDILITRYKDWKISMYCEGMLQALEEYDKKRSD